MLRKSFQLTDLWCLFCAKVALEEVILDLRMSVCLSERAQEKAKERA